MAQDPKDPATADGLPTGVRLYMDHACHGVPLREIARREGLAASTVLRRVRRVETRRDDPLIDSALEALETTQTTSPDPVARTAAQPGVSTPAALFDAAALAHEARRLLRRLIEPQAILVIAPDLEKAVVLRRMPDGQELRTAVVARATAQAFALQDWICLTRPGRPAVYEITSVGRAALRRMSVDAALDKPGLAETASPFAGQHRIWAEKPLLSAEGSDAGRRLRYNLAESPVAALGRRRDKDGVPFLTPDLVEAGERLREDFELAQMGPRVAQNWERFLTGPSQGGFGPGRPMEGGSGSARERVGRALRELGPGLGDMVLRCCCHLEGLEAAEKRLGWSARSGKIVLRIALQRLKCHYAEAYGTGSPLIG